MNSATTAIPAADTGLPSSNWPNPVEVELRAETVYRATRLLSIVDDAVFVEVSDDLRGCFLRGGLGGYSVFALTEDQVTALREAMLHVYLSAQSLSKLWAEDGRAGHERERHPR